MSKLPIVTVVFWIMKIIATTLGESGADMVSQTLNLGYLSSTFLFLGLFVISLVAQLRAKRYHPAIFWAVILTTSTAGTTISDFMNRTAGLGYLGGALVLTAMLIVVFIVWRVSGQTMNVERINTFRGEVLYWVATLVSNTLGTSTGDLLAHNTGIGFVASTVLLTAVLILVVAAHYLTPISGTALFWVAYVLTRPFGANAGNTLTKTHDEGGVGLGTYGASALLFGLLVAMVIYQSVTLRRQTREISDESGQVTAPSGSV
jgi:uncharacterized membrane-anchored protein